MPHTTAPPRTSRLLLVPAIWRGVDFDDFGFDEKEIGEMETERENR